MSGTTLTPRERAVLAAVERRLTNPEIAAEEFVSVRTVESHIASLRRKLGARSRGDLIAAAGRLRIAALPVPPSTFHGRSDDLARLAALYETHAWVTVCGLGGVGKTRLALEFANAGDRRPVLVELEHAGPEDVLARIARAVGVEATAADVPAGVVTALSAHSYLLVLDDIDRVTVEVRALLNRILPAVPLLHVLATSRTAVGAPAEAVLTIEPLAVDGDDAPASALLIERLESTGDRLRLADRDRAAEIARRLDGVPLALELAASVARHIPLAELVERVGAGIATLDRAAPEGKHRTLATAFDWSWDLLTSAERRLLCRLAALPRTFDLALADAVAAHDAPDETGETVEGLVLRLVDRSLVVPSRPAGRFRVLAVVREFALAHTNAEEIRDVRRRHAEFCERIAREFVADARRDDSPEASRRSEILCPEVNAALRWALAARDPHALSLARSLSIGVEQYGADVDTVHSLALAARDDDVLDAARPDVLYLLGAALAYLDTALVDDLAERALAIAADDDELLSAHQLMGLSLAYRGLGQRALPHLAAAEHRARVVGDAWEAAAATQMRGIALLSDDLVDVDGALAAFETSLRRYGRAGDSLHANNVRYMMALLCAEHGRNHDQAREWAAACVAYATSVENAHEVAHGQLAQAMLGTFEGDLVALTQAFRAVGDLRCVFRTLLVRAHEQAGPARLHLLAEAADTASAAHDHRREALALTEAVALHAALGDRIGALAGLDRLADVAGEEAAAAACPAALLDDFLADRSPPT